MPLFQSSVLNKYLAAQDEKQVASAYLKYTQYFLNSAIQQNIRNSNEEQFQQKFLMELFVNILGYTMNPDPDFNLTTELKNIKDAKKTDGAILNAKGSAIAVIELKGTDTKDLAKVNEQAFNYKNNQPDCVYVITSNFEKLRFFIHNVIEHEEFNLFNLTVERFSLLWLFLQKDNLLSGIPAKVKEESLLEEDRITKELYKDYSAFKNDLWSDMVQKNAHHAPLLLYKKSQKLLDRFLFIFFAEDKGLLPPNSISQIVTQWDQLNELDAYTPLYERLKLYFGYMNEGRKITGKAEIHAYNGGLFKADPLLDDLIIDDELLKRHCLKLTNYDFDDEVDTNILGHIFEHSLNDIENVRAQLSGEEVDKSKTKRKKDGVFYTPKYITKYIVDNTVGKLCEEKKAEIGIDDEEFAKDRKGRRKDTIKKLDTQLKQYRDWLLKLTICDPACGSGAFLNQALEFLMAEHRYVDELEAMLFEGSIVFQDVENHILEYNIFGVDINEESVEIARLSLWLRTAQKGRKLTSLSSNIKCGNSLIDDPEVAGDLAFNWQKQFPKVFSKGGFDAIIGNPPYGAKINHASQKFLNDRFIKGGSETAISFLMLADELLQVNRPLGFIIPKSFSYASNYKYVREHLVNNISSIVDCKKVWKEVKLEQVIVIFNKQHTTSSYKSAIKSNRDIFEVGEIHKSTFLEFGFLLNGISSKELKTALKIKKSGKNLCDIALNQRGVGLQRFIEEQGQLPVLAGANVQRNGIKGIRGYIQEKNVGSDPKSFVKDNSVLVQNIVSHVENPVDHVKIIATIGERSLENEIVILDTINQISIIDDLYSNNIVEELLNSKLINWYSYRFLFGKAIRTLHFDNAITDRIPLPPHNKLLFESINRKSLNKKDLVQEFNKKNKLFTSYLGELFFDSNNIPKALQNSTELEFKTFLRQIKKHSINEGMSSNQEFELFELFEKKRQEFQPIKNQISILNEQINDDIFSLYELQIEDIETITNQMP